MSVHPLLVATLVAPMLFSCDRERTWRDTLALVRRDFPTVEQLSTEELARWLADPQRAAPLLLDVRSPEEFAVSHLPGARNVDPDATAAEVLGGVPPAREIVCYCSVGYRSSRLAQRLQGAGHGRVWNLEGSLFQWANEGRELRDARGPTRRVHPYDESWGRLLSPSVERATH